MRVQSTYGQFVRKVPRHAHSLLVSEGAWRTSNPQRVGSDNLDEVDKAGRSMGRPAFCKERS